MRDIDLILHIIQLFMAVNVASNAASAVLQGKSVSVINSKAAEAAARAAQLNRKLGIADPTPEEIRKQQEEAKAPIMVYTNEELEVNDFPQQARIRVTRKDALMDIMEATGAVITVRGQYIAPKTVPKEGERKLYLAVEGRSEQIVQSAISAIARALKEELLAAETSFNPAARLMNPGKYKVLALTNK